MTPPKSIRDEMQHRRPQNNKQEDVVGVVVHEEVVSPPGSVHSKTFATRANTWNLCTVHVFYSEASATAL